MTENDRILSAHAEEMNATHAALDELRVPRAQEGDLLTLPKRIVWLKRTRLAPADADQPSAGSETPAAAAPAETTGQAAATTDGEWVAETDGVMWGVTPRSAPMLFRLCESEEAARELAARWNAGEAR